MIQLFRFKNLIFIVITQWLIYTAIISPIFDKYGLTTLMPAAAFWLMVLATVLIAAGGYVINDYFDLKIDRINRPESVVIGEQLSKKSAMRLYIALTGVGVLIGIVVVLLVDLQAAVPYRQRHRFAVLCSGSTRFACCREWGTDRILRRPHKADTCLATTFQMGMRICRICLLHNAYTRDCQRYGRPRRRPSDGVSYVAYRMGRT